MRILFVCTGNTCRSPMAEKLLRKMAAENEMDIQVQSAGIFASPGSAASSHAATVLDKKGITEAHQSQIVSESLIDWADLVMTMTESHKHTLLQQFPDYEDKIYTLKEYTDASPETQERNEELECLYARLAEKQEEFMKQHREEIHRLEDQYQALYSQLELVREELDEWKERIMRETVEERNQIAILERQTPNYDIGDPFGGSLEMYERCASEIEKSLEQLLAVLKEEAQSASERNY
ncbi:low molecular weight protein arginine phosphatase [Aneurinibacillus tyrosinisolvens]|uniref:low molecular weight protein arginine phosphatase n=1 Tax=Aneurinibacillus tyrosinisolvens TaxID=1443435 RepID=UPI00063EEF05|nr:low molecular weight protein arginine phosphatase [Aneurinibacillus tyrosinisolvens]